MIENISSSIGKVMKEYRKDEHITLQMLADKIKIDKSTLSKYESANIELKVETLLEITNALGIRIDHFITRVVDFCPGRKSGYRRSNPGTSSQNYFMWFNDPRKENVLKVSRISTAPEGDTGAYSASCFYMLKDVNDDESNYHVYEGEGSVDEELINFDFYNTQKQGERMNLILKTPYRYEGILYGYWTGYSRRSNDFIHFPVIVSEYEIKDKGSLQRFLLENGNDLAPHIEEGITEDFLRRTQL